MSTVGVFSQGGIFLGREGLFFVEGGGISWEGIFREYFPRRRMVFSRKVLSRRDFPGVITRGGGNRQQPQRKKYFIQLQGIFFVQDIREKDPFGYI